MRKIVRSLLALALALGVGACANALDHGYGNDSYASQIGYDSFNLSVKKRLASARVGSPTRYFGTAPVLVQSEDAYAAPSSRSASVASASRRQLDCVYYSGFTVWADMYQTWARQNSRGGGDGYKYRATGPVVGFDWSNGPLTIGLATTYNWAKLKGRSTSHERKVRHWGLELYGQYDTEAWYANATLGYSYNRFRSSRYQPDHLGIMLTGGSSNRDRYHSSAFNIDGEFGYKFNFSGFKVVPNVGVRYFHDRRGSISEDGLEYTMNVGRENYHVFELPIGVDLSYEIQAGASVFVPRFRAAWIPEIFRRRGNANGTADINGFNVAFDDNGARRSRHGFQLGLGFEAKVTKSFSAHIDYNVNLRSGAYEHHWNLGAGFTF